MKSKFLFAVLVALIGFTSCEETSKADPNMEEKASKNQVNVDEVGFEMGIEIPEEYLANNEPEVFFNEAVGLLEIKAGENFQLEISDLDFDLTTFKESLQREMMFEYKISNEDPTGFIFQSFLPDGTEYSSNFIQQFEMNGKKYTAKSKKDNEFSLDQIMKMKTSINSVKTI